LIASNCFAVDVLGSITIQILVKVSSDWGEENPDISLLDGSQIGAHLWAGIANACGRAFRWNEVAWLHQAAKIEGKKSWHDLSTEWKDVARFCSELWGNALLSDQWPKSPEAVLATANGLIALDNAVLQVLREGEGHDGAQPFIQAWKEARADAVVSGLDKRESWAAWLTPLPVALAPTSRDAFINGIRGEWPSDWTYSFPRATEIVLRVVYAAHKRFLMARAPTVASNTLAQLRRGLSPHVRSERRENTWELLDAVGSRVAHAEGLDGGPLALLPARALEQLARSGNEVLRSPNGLRVILGICSLARQKAAGLSNASPHLIFNGLEDLVTRCCLPVNKRTIAAAREVIAAGQVWRWADERGGSAGLWTYTYHLDGGSGDGRVSRLTIVPGLPLLPTRGERGVLLAPLPMLGSLGAPRLVGGEAQLHLALCAEIQTASATLREGIGLVCEGEPLQRLARESGLKVEQVRTALERWISEGVLSREANGGVLWGEARAEARAFIIDQGEHRRSESERGKASVLKRRAAKK
jgi:hypothetical protein